MRFSFVIALKTIKVFETFARIEAKNCKSQKSNKKFENISIQSNLNFQEEWKNIFFPKKPRNLPKQI